MAHRKPWPCAALALAASLSFASAAGAASAPQDAALRPSAELDLGALEALVRARARGVETASLEVDLAAAEVKKSHTLPNPTLEASWGTIPIGQTNPPGLSSPMTQVPNYGVSLAYTFPLGKRGPLQDRARALERAARAGLSADVRVRALSLARTLGVLAATTMRLEGLRRMADEGRKQAELGEARHAADFAPGLEVERLKIEASRLEQSVRSAESEVSTALADCTATLGAPCEPFADAGAARTFLARWIERVGAAGRVEDRPDVRALAAYGEAASAEVRWAKAQAIPDPTVRFGYLRDQFVISGNHVNSLSLSVSIPLPIFDRGQAELAAAEAKRTRASAERQKTLETSRSRLPVLEQRLAAQKKRQRSLSEEILPRAEGTLKELARAAEGRLLPLTDVIQARRTVSELVVAEAESFAEAFDAALEIAAELGRTNEDPR
ncbi:TolC family protein [Polyangium mundeleinium]|uniref:TolC family protein n=1 Tax=Polyangium mundeleinium TaxID=2995306 RepID=A0ABT5ELH4_9BACT|nr:TolC family protein [Polyangium mundeleinium]MDC0742237.1 TolC family protein [Polyangium mundeleinium]